MPREARYDSTILETGDGQALASKLELVTLPCTYETGGSVTDPPCEAGEAEGTQVQVMMSSGCQLGYVRGSVAAQRLADFGASKYRLAFAYDNGSQIIVVVGTGAADGFRTVFLAKGSGGVNGISVADALSGSDGCGSDVTSQVAVICGFDAAAQTYHAYFPSATNVPGANDLSSLTQGLGYWVVLNDASSTVNWMVQTA